LHNLIQSVPVTLFVCVSVRCLDVSMSGLPAGAHITDDGLVPVISRCHQLTTLSISRLSLVCMPRQAVSLCMLQLGQLAARCCVVVETETP